MESQRPKFLPSYLGLLKKEAEQSSWFAVIPYALIASIFLGAAVALFTPSEFWTNSRWDVSTAVLAGLLTFNGLVLALGWNAFARIYDALFRKEFVSFLSKHDQLNPYIVHIGFMHFMQISAVIASGVALFFVLFNSVPIAIDRFVFGTSISLTIYAVKQAIDAVSMMNDLVWQVAYFESNPIPKDQRDKVRGNVVPAFGERNGD